MQTAVSLQPMIKKKAVRNYFWGGDNLDQIRSQRFKQNILFCGGFLFSVQLSLYDNKPTLGYKCAIGKED